MPHNHAAYLGSTGGWLVISLRIPRDVDQHSELMSITIPK